MSLEDALSLVLLYAAVDDDKYERAAPKWIGRLTQERVLTLGEIQLAVGSLQAIRERPEAAVTVLRLVVRGHRDEGPSTLRIAEALGLPLSASS